MPQSRIQRVALGSIRVVIYALAGAALLVGLAVGAIETAWGKDQLRRLIVQQANEYLTATLDIERLEGSLFGGFELGNVRLSREGAVLVAIDEVSLSYSVRELMGPGLGVRRLRLTRPRVNIGRLPDGRWDLAAIVTRTSPTGPTTGPGRPVVLHSIEVVEGTVVVRDPVRFGAAHVPTRYEALTLSLSFAYAPAAWRLAFTDASWTGEAPGLTVRRLAGAIASEPGGLSFTDLRVETPETAFTLRGRINRDVTPSVLDLHVTADRFAFQEWAGVIRELGNIVVDAAFDVRLKGPLAKLGVDLALQSTGGDVRGALVLDTTAPGWRGAGSVDLARLDISRWFNMPDRPSDISGRVDFDLTQFAPRFPRGSYAFNGRRTAFLGYEADRLRARGTITAHGVRIAEATGVAYGAAISIRESDIAIDRPFAFRFLGAAVDVDLREVPDFFPVPRVESRLTFDYAVAGQFADAFVEARADFAVSQFLGATIGAGATGTLDTSTRPFRYSGEGQLDEVALQRFGAELGAAWLEEPRYAGTVSGRFTVEGGGGDLATLSLRGGGRLRRAELFQGTLEDADVSIQIEAGSIEGSYDGRVSSVNAAIPLADARFDSSLTGSGRARIAVRDLFVRSPGLADYTIDAAASLAGSTVRGVEVDSSRIEGRLSDGVLSVAEAQVAGPAIEARGSGLVPLDGERGAHFDYDVIRAELPRLSELLGRDVSGTMTTQGRLTGPTSAVRLEGSATIDGLKAEGVAALSATATYDVTIPPTAPARTRAHIKGRASNLALLDQPLQHAEGAATYDDEHLAFNVSLQREEGVEGTIAGSVALHLNRRTLDVASLTLAVQNTAWELAPPAGPLTLSWDEAGIVAPRIVFTNRTSAESRVAISGTWRWDGSGAMRVAATRVFLDSLAARPDGPAPYGGVIDLDATIRGPWQQPRLESQLTITDGRIRRFPYERLAGRVDYSDGVMQLDLRLDQSPGVWMSAVGAAPLAFFDADWPERPMNVAIKSSVIGLELLEGVTDVVRDVAGQVEVNLTASGTSHDPRITGSIDVARAAFLMTLSGARYRNGRAALQFGSDRVNVREFHLEDSRGRTFDMKGSLGTRELRVGDLEIDAAGRRFQVLDNEFGAVEVDARLSFRGQFDSPRVTGVVTVVGGDLNLSEILDRTLLRPYSTEAAGAPSLDPLVPFNPWTRLGLYIELRVPNTLRLTGDDVQVGVGTPLGFGSFNLRALGDLYLYKDPNQPLYVTGSLDSVTGTYAFQGRRFDIDPTSSIDFRGDLTPEVFITVKRVISGVEARVTIAGTLSDPEIRLASTPPLESSDILSLIVFNTTTNQLSATQQADLAVRAGTLAAGFLATPLIAALERSLGLDILEIEATGERGTARVTVGDEVAPGLVARFSRQFGREEYDEATLEYALSRIFRIRATFSDAGSLIARSPFRRVERAGIDLIAFFSF